MKKNIAIVLLLIVIGVLGYLVLKPKATDVSITNTPAQPTDTTSGGSPVKSQDPLLEQGSIKGMKQYTDTSFGFSFWYPSTWQVIVSPQALAFGAQLTNVTVVKKIGLQAPGETYPSILIQEAHSTTRTITDTGGAGPIGPVTYYFDATNHLWMTTPPEGDGATKPADISINTMGGLHMFGGTSRFDTSIIPLSANNFVVIGDNGGANARVVAQTVVALDPKVAVPVSKEQQAQIIEQEKTDIQP